VDQLRGFFDREASADMAAWISSAAMTISYREHN
jgi:hypothetical protein